MDALIETLNQFGETTGLRINYDKTQILRLGSLRHTEAKLITQSTISWSHRIKVLGLYLTADKEETIQINYDKVV